VHHSDLLYFLVCGAQGSQTQELENLVDRWVQKEGSVTQRLVDVVCLWGEEGVRGVSQLNCSK